MTHPDNRTAAADSWPLDGTPSSGSPGVSSFLRDCVLSSLRLSCTSPLLRDPGLFRCGLLFLYSSSSVVSCCLHFSFPYSSSTPPPLFSFLLAHLLRSTPPALRAPYSIIISSAPPLLVAYFHLLPLLLVVSLFSLSWTLLWSWVAHSLARLLLLRVFHIL